MIGKCVEEIMDGLRGPVESIGTQTTVDGQTGTIPSSTETQTPGTSTVSNDATQATNNPETKMDAVVQEGGSVNA